MESRGDHTTGIIGHITIDLGRYHSESDTETEGLFENHGNDIRSCYDFSIVQSGEIKNAGRVASVMLVFLLSESGKRSNARL